MKEWDKFEKGSEYKERELLKLKEEYVISCVFDDDEDVCQVCDKLDIECYKVTPSDYKM